MLSDEFLSARTKTMMKLISLKILMIKFFCKEGKEVGLRSISTSCSSSSRLYGSVNLSEFNM